MRLPQWLNLTTSRTKQFCETSSFFELDNIQNEAILRGIFNFWTWQHQNKAILRDFLQKWKVECSADGLIPMRFAIFPLHLSKVLRPATKNWCQVIRSAAPVTQNHLSKPTDLMLQNATRLRKSAPWPPNISDEHVFCIAPAMRHVSLQILFKCPTPAIVFGNATTLTFCSLLRRCTIPCACQAKRHPNVQKWAEPVVFCTFLTSKCASCHNGVHFFDISTSKSGVCCAFWLQNVLRAKTACPFSTSQLPKMVRTWGVFTFFTCKCASRHNVFDIATSKSGPKLKCFVHFGLEMCFAPQRRAIFHLSSGQMAPHPPL